MMIRIVLTVLLSVGTSTSVSGRTLNRNDFLDTARNEVPDQIHLGSPRNLTVTSMGDDKSFARVKVSWEPPTGFDGELGESAIKEYILYYVQASGENWKTLKLPGSIAAVAITGLHKNTEYFFRIEGNTSSMKGRLSDSVFFATGDAEGSAFDIETEDAFDNEHGDLE